jgi:Zn-dependent M28 family amino/carboxypeptidase
VTGFGLSWMLIALSLVIALIEPKEVSRTPEKSSAPAMHRVSMKSSEPGAAKGRDSEAALLLRWVRTLSDPRWDGRGVGTAGLDSAAAFIAAQMKQLGLEPGGEQGTYFQAMEVTTGVAVGEPSQIEVAGHRFSTGSDFQPLGFSTNGTLRAPVVFAGYGISAPGFNYDDYAGLDVRDKLVLVLTQEPGEMDSTSRFDGSINTPHAELRTKAINAREHGALGLLVVHGPRYHAGEPLRKARADGAGYMTSGLIAAQVSGEVANSLLAPTRLTLEQAQMAIDAHTRPHSLALPESATVTVTLTRVRATIRNVVGWVPGRDSLRTLVIGAHYDHLGRGGEGSLTPDTHAPHPGADDNASGVAALLGVANRLLSRSGDKENASALTSSIRSRSRSGPTLPHHNLIFCAFTGEEIGLVGSSQFVSDPTRPLETIEVMLNMDMVGRLRDNKLLVMGVGTASEFTALLENANRAAGFALKTSSDGFGPSDHSSFYKKNVPVLALFTGAHADYHRPSDTWDKIDATGLARVTRFAAALVESLDARPAPHYQKATGDNIVGRIAGGGGYGAYLGTIPDYLQTEGGVLLTGVRAGSPAERAGIQGGDVIVGFDGVRIDNIYDYTFALRSRKPGQQVRITTKRASREFERIATLGRRP